MEGGKDQSFALLLSSIMKVRVPLLFSSYRVWEFLITTEANAPTPRPTTPSRRCIHGGEGDVAHVALYVVSYFLQCLDKEEGR